MVYAIASDDAVEKRESYIIASKASGTANRKVIMGRGPYGPQLKMPRLTARDIACRLAVAYEFCDYLLNFYLLSGGCFD